MKPVKITIAGLGALAMGTAGCGMVYTSASGAVSEKRVSDKLVSKTEIFDSWVCVLAEDAPPHKPPRYETDSTIPSYISDTPDGWKARPDREGKRSSASTRSVSFSASAKSSVSIRLGFKPPDHGNSPQTRIIPKCEREGYMRVWQPDKSVKTQCAFRFEGGAVPVGPILPSAVSFENECEK